jgi:hypothetical protein
MIQDVYTGPGFLSIPGLGVETAPDPDPQHWFFFAQNNYRLFFAF